MQFLYVLERLRRPALDAVFSVVTYCGDELAFLVLAFALFWCVSKRGGYYAFLVGLFGTLGNQFLKLVCRIPRPWVLDPNFTIVESARAAATGYSFPSGHTQNAVGTFGAMAVTAKRRWVRWVCAALIVLVPFSRMYLGVHTPLDVGVAFALALVLLVALYPAFRSDDAQAKAMPWLLGAALVLAAAFYAYASGLRVDALDAEAASNITHGAQNAAKLLGAIAALPLMYWIEKRYINFDTRAVWYAQALKLILGLALLLAVKTVLKAPLLAILPEGLAGAARYFILVLCAGCVWPLTFRFWAKLGRKNA